MTIQGLRTFEPQLELTVISGFSTSLFPSLRDRVIECRLEDDKKKADRAVITFNNEDGALINISELAFGAVIDLSFGYPGAMSIPRRLSVRKIKGAVFSGSVAGRATGRPER